MHIIPLFGAYKSLGATRKGASIQLASLLPARSTSAQRDEAKATVTVPCNGGERQPLFPLFLLPSHLPFSVASSSMSDTARPHKRQRVEIPSFMSRQTVIFRMAPMDEKAASFHSTPGLCAQAAASRKRHGTGRSGRRWERRERRRRPKVEGAGGKSISLLVPIFT